MEKYFSLLGTILLPESNLVGEGVTPTAVAHKSLTQALRAFSILSYRSHVDYLYLLFVHIIS